MKNKKEFKIRVNEDLFLRIKELSKTEKSVNQTIVNLIVKGLSKNKNDYNELINFFSKNIITKMNKEFTDYRYFLRKFLLNNSAISAPLSQEKPTEILKQKPEIKESFFDKVAKSANKNK